MSSTGPEPSDERAAALERVRSSSRRLEDTSAAHRKASTEFADTLYEAHQAGLTWVELARAAGLDRPATARSRAQRSDAAAHDSRTDERPGFTAEVVESTMSVTEAAAHYDVSRPTIYTWIESGRLRSVRNERNGRVRILRDQDPAG